MPRVSEQALFSPIGQDENNQVVLRNTWGREKEGEEEGAEEEDVQRSQDAPPPTQLPDRAEGPLTAKSMQLYVAVAKRVEGTKDTSTVNARRRPNRIGECLPRAELSAAPFADAARMMRAN